MPSGPPAAPYTIPGLGAFSSKDWTPEQWLQIEALVNLLQGGYAQLAKPQNALVDANGNVVTSALGNVVPGLPGLVGLIELLAHKDAASGYAGLDLNTLLKLAEWPFHFGWVNAGDAAGVITINEALGTDVASIGFRSGTLAGDYKLSLPFTAGSAFWVIAGTAMNTPGSFNLKVTLNQANPSHTATAINFMAVDSSGTPQRATEMGLVWVTKR